ncbi:enoyl-CoA hydratase/isomerase family protein [Rhodobacterales bacterium HKCCE2091]|nr:enoyl-CoA hydratase/isomerase family protein [Rhodobacterales bacterium HKCCE2091]
MTELLTEDRGAIRILTLNRPEKRNALNNALTGALVDGLAAADADPDVRAVVLTGAGKGFCAGADLSEFAELTPDHAERVAARAELTSTLQSTIAAIATPVVAAVHGAAIGGGGGLALSADMLIVATGTKLGFPELKHDIVPALVMPNITRHFGRKLGFELISTGRLLGASELVALGAANAEVAEAEVLDAALAVAETWAAAKPVAMAAAKRLFHAVSETGPEDGFAEGRRVNREMRGFRA